MKLKERLKNEVWNNIKFWRFQVFINIIFMIVLVCIIFYLLGEYENVYDALMECLGK